MRQGIRELASRGQFHDGVFTWHDAAGERYNQDGYEAVWEHIDGRTLQYPRPRYQVPVIMEPAHFGWLAHPPGVALKRLVCVNERALGVAM